MKLTKKCKNALNNVKKPIKEEWVERVLKKENQIHENPPNINCLEIWGYIKEENKYLKLVFLKDCETINNVYFDRGMKNKMLLKNQKFLPNNANPQGIESKLINYSLNFNHESGKHKAKLFKDLLGITLESVNQLITIIKDGIKTNEISEITVNDFGIKYTVEIAVENQSKIYPIVTVWIIKNDEYFPDLVTCYIK